MRFNCRVLISILVIALALSFNTSLSELEEAHAQDPVFALWYLGSITLDDEYRGKRTYPVVLYVRDVRRRGYFRGFLWYQEADAITEVYGRLTATSELHWFLEKWLLYPDFKNALERNFQETYPIPCSSNTMMYYKGFGHNWATLNHGLRSASWELQPSHGTTTLTMITGKASK